MKILHKKSHCCNAKIIRFGGKRRQCVACKKTWRVYPSQRGPKPSRQQRNYLNNVFKQKMRVSHLTVHSQLPATTIYKRFGKNLNRLVDDKRTVYIKGRKLILIIDAQYRYFKRQLWTIYIMAVKATNSQTVVVLDPVIIKGRESASHWEQMFSQLPPGIKKRVIAVVCDGIRGIETIIANSQWIIQRCHFHLISALQKRRGKRASTKGRNVRETIYQLTRLALVEKSSSKLDQICKELATLAHYDECPGAMRMIVRDFLRRFFEFRADLTFPTLNLPLTTNVMESINSVINERSRTVNTPKAWHKWATACIRMKSKFTCK